MSESTATPLRDRSVLRDALVLSLIIVLMSVPWLGREFSTRGEPREALVAQSIVTSGNWILPLGYSGDIPSKPLFTHWMTALAAKVQGSMSEAASRAPGAVGFIIFTVLFYLFLARRVSRDEALGASLVLLSAIEWSNSAVSARVDSVLAVTLAGGLLSLYAWSERDLRGIPLLSIVLFSAATLTKGPVALVLPAAIFGFFLTIREVPIARMLAACSKVFLLAAAIASVWYLLAFSDGGERFSAKVFYENFQRFLSMTEDKPHKHSIFFLFGTILSGFLPWTGGVLLGLAVALVRRIKTRAPFDITRFAPMKIWQSAREQVPLMLFFLLAIVLFILFFSIPSSKRGEYLLPIYPLLAFFIARTVAQFSETQLWCVRTWNRALALFIALLVMALPLLSRGLLDPALFVRSSSALTQVRYFIGVLDPYRWDWHELLVVSALLYSFMWTLFFETRANFMKRPITASAVLYLSLWFTVQAVFIPKISASLSEKRFAQQIEQSGLASQPLYSFRNEFYGTSFYLNKRIERVNDPEDRITGHHLVAGDYVVIFERKIDELRAVLPRDLVPVPKLTSAPGVINPAARASVVMIESADGKFR